MEVQQVEEVDSLSRLEERIQKAAELVSALRRERDEALRQRDEALRDVASLSRELEALRGERIQVRKRIEKLLGQMELLSST